jgi:transcriptional regulator with XRE-family HTH domain
MGHSRNRPQLLSEKLLAIRDFLKFAQPDMASKLQFEILSHSRQQYRITSARISEYENGKREPNLLVMIAYVRLGQLHMESLADDQVTVDDFRKRVGKQFDHAELSTPDKSQPNKPVTLITGTR